MLLFDTNQSGIIEINDEDWKSFIKTDHMSAELLKMRAMVTRDYDFSRKEFFRWKDLLYDAQLNLKQFQLVERGETYKDTNIEENENLILAFNDNFLKLFMLLAKELEIVYI
jgi:serine/threonine-protein kinase ULK/ATG1